ncbi:MAG TPA: hypothetical protein VIX20_12400 [Ktedonobacteraceae bacterium]
MDGQIKIFGVLIAIAALLFALPTFFPGVNALSILTLFGLETMYNSNNGTIILAILAICLLLLILWICIHNLPRMKAFSVSKKARDRFRADVLKFWNLADYATYMYEVEKKSKDGLPLFSTVLHPSPPAWLIKQWDSGKGADNIDSQATSILQNLWSYLDSPSQASRANKQRAWSDNTQQKSEDMIAQVRILSRLIRVFLLRPDWVPLPRAMCIMRYKSLQFLEKPTISDNEFRKSLMYAGFSHAQVESLRNWLYEPVNLKWIRQNSVKNIAAALKNAGITAKPREDVVNCWKRNLSSYTHDVCSPTH